MVTSHSDFPLWSVGHTIAPSGSYARKSIVRGVTAVSSSKLTQSASKRW